jgi:hypothetical protein
MGYVRGVKAAIFLYIGNTAATNWTPIIEVEWKLHVNLCGVF